ncbi:ran-binding protein 9-like [Frankliniella occidentalis]|uniref:Ran-binding protein 9-like n=1 Tax=Frankliniella occidentalis TaxID=133901 RepID=A0A9C6WUK4_FRAOC|nr:ran-binding protein 9-like [Frankliniella occidentalis]
MTGEDALAKYREVFSYSKNRLARTDRRELVRQLLDHPHADRRTPASTPGAGGVGDALCLLNPFASIGLGRELQPPPAVTHRGAPQHQRAAPPQQRPPPPPSIAPLHVTALVLPPPAPAGARRRPNYAGSTDGKF